MKVCTYLCSEKLLDACIKVLLPKPFYVGINISVPFTVNRLVAPLAILLFFSASWTSLSFGVLTTPLENLFSSGHSVTVTRPKNGNLMVWLLIVKPLRLGKYSSSKYFNWLKEISSPASSPPSSVTTSVNLLHSAIIISLSCTKLLAVEEGTKQLNPWHSDTLKFRRFLNDTEDGSKFFNLPHFDTWPDVEKACLVGSFHDKFVTDWAFQMALTLSNVRASQHVVLLYQLVDVHISLQWKNVRRRVSWDCTILEPATTKTHSIYLMVHQNPVLISILPSWGIYPAKS